MPLLLRVELMGQFLFGFTLGVIVGYLAILMAVLYEFSEGTEIAKG